MRYITKIVCAVALFIFSTGYAMALDKSYYASSSKLATGRWAKVKVSTTGVQELSHEQLAQWGFNDASKVKIFGYGGKTFPEVISKDQPDDLEQVATQNLGNKIYFYGVSGINTSSFNVKSNTPRFLSAMNPYSCEGYYFITDSENFSPLTIGIQNNTDNGTITVDKCFDYTYREEEIINPGLTGMFFLGDKLNVNAPTTFNMSMPGVVAGESMLLNSCIAAVSSSVSYFGVKLNGEDVSYNANSNKISGMSTSYQYYSRGNAYTTFTPSAENSTEDGKLEISLSSTGNIEAAYLDYIYIRYTRRLGITNRENQARAFIQAYKSGSRLMLNNVDGNCKLWFVGEDNDVLQQPVEFKINLETDGDGVATGNGSCTPSPNFKVNGYSDWAKFVVFDTTREQYKAEIVGAVENQNLHAMEVPHMLIITTKELLPKAQILADYHKTHDKMDVAVVDHQLIFNEFTSGTPDASAYRRLGKMLYDRDNSKFQYIILFGGGSFDNRGIANKPGTELLLTYQSEWSEEETRSYVTDDYFTFYDESTYARHSIDKMRVAIGRFPVTTPQEAQQALDKLFEYQSSDNNYWRNNMLIFSDLGEEELFTYQSEGVQKLVNDSLDIPMHVNKMYTQLFSTYHIENGVNEAEDMLAQCLKEGNLFATYIGHGGPEFLSKTKHVWSCSSVSRYQYPYLPIMSLATCDVARYDSGMRGVAEQMFHARHGGAVALLASTRTVYASENDVLNRAFIRALFTLNEDGSYRTIGQAVQLAKNSFSKTSLNKLNFTLLGDPAMKIKFPKKRIASITINGTDASSASLSPMTQVTIAGKVTDASGNTDTSFNGVVTAVVYDKAFKYKDISMSTVLPTHTSMIRNEHLGKIDGEVKNGVFEVKYFIPATVNASVDDNTAQLCVYAQNVNGDIVNGIATGIAMGDYDETTAITDNVAPVIEEMWINEPEFQNNDKIAQSASLYFRISESQSAVSSNTLGLGQGITLILDEKVSINAANVFTFNSATHSGDAQVDLTSYLTEGYHTLRLVASDVAGNHTDRVVGFYFTPRQYTVDVATAHNAVRDNVTFAIAPGEGFDAPIYTIYVTDANGKTVWRKSQSTAICEWNLTLENGNRLAPGVYNYYVTAIEGTATAGSPIRTIAITK